ncbi:MAG: STAS domain-containing protein [Planctomycetota bacterium]|jgi:anti-anti-sigma factor
MSMQVWPEGVVLVELTGESETGEELENVICYVQDRGNCDVVVDFSNVTILTSRSLAPLLRLRDLLGRCGKRLLLCCVDRAATGIFSVTALDGVFEIVNDRIHALTTVQALPDSLTAIRNDSP